MDYIDYVYNLRDVVIHYKRLKRYMVRENTFPKPFSKTLLIHSFSARSTVIAWLTKSHYISRVYNYFFLIAGNFKTKQIP